MIEEDHCNMKHMSPYELGETGSKAAIPYLEKYLQSKTPNDVRLAASAIGKLLVNHRASCKYLIPLMFKALETEGPQARQYLLKALHDLDFPSPPDDNGILQKIATTDEKKYNRDGALSLLSRINPLNDAVECLNNTFMEDKCPFKKLIKEKDHDSLDGQLSYNNLSFDKAQEIAKQHAMSTVVSNGDDSFKVILRNVGECTVMQEESSDRFGKPIYILKGNWAEGIAYDLHTLTSEYLGQDTNGHDSYETKRSEMGELVYKLKYRRDVTVTRSIVNLIQKVVDFSKVDAIVTIPPSNIDRMYQPVDLIASEIGKRFKTKIYYDALKKTGCSEQLKAIEDPDKRTEVLKSTMQFTGNHDLSGKTILLLDDLFRSGSTLKVATQLLLENAKVQNVYVLTMTKTRRNR